MALWGTKDSVYADGTVAVNFSTLKVVGTGTTFNTAGLIKAGDIILEFDGKRINTMKKLPNVVASTEVGKSVELKIWRNKKEITKTITLGRLETSEDFRAESPKVPKVETINALKIEVRPTTKEDIIQRQLPQNVSGLVITKIEADSPINYLKVNDIIVEAGKRKVRSASQLNNLVNTALKSQNKTILIAIFNNQNQKRYIGVKLD